MHPIHLRHRIRQPHRTLLHRVRRGVISRSSVAPSLTTTRIDPACISAGTANRTFTTRASA